MMWTDDLREEMQRRQATEDLAREELRREQEAATDEAVARVDALVRTLYTQMNQTLLGGRGTVWDTPASWGIHLWELWWEPTRDGGRYLVVTLLRDSRGTPYLKVQGRRLSVEDARLERRLQRALRAGFLAPRVYMPRTQVPVGTRELTRAAPQGNGRGSERLTDLRHDADPATAGSATGEPGDETWARTTQGRRRARRDKRDEA